jgi:hypothetical protein
MPEPRPWSVREQIAVGITQCEIAEAACRDHDFETAAVAQRMAEDAYRRVEAEIGDMAMPPELRTELDRLRLALIKLTRLRTR